MSPSRERTMYWIYLVLTMITIANVMAWEQAKEMPWLLLAMLLISALGFLAGHIEGRRTERGISDPI